MNRLESRAPGLLLVLVGVGLCIGAASYGVTTASGRMGPGLMPGVAGVALLLLGGTLALVGERPAAAADELAPAGAAPAVRPGLAPSGAAPAVRPAVDGDAPPVAGGPVDPALPGPVGPAYVAQVVEHPRRPWIIFALVTAALLLTSYTGLLAALAVMTVLLLRLVEKESWRMTLVVTAASIGGTWLIFVQLLNVPMPSGIFGG